MTLWCGTLDFTIHAASEESARIAMAQFCRNAEQHMLPSTATLNMAPESEIEAQPGSDDGGPLFCPHCANERNIPIPSHCPHIT